MASTDPQTPNIIFVLSDDQAHGPWAARERRARYAQPRPHRSHWNQVRELLLRLSGLLARSCIHSHRADTVAARSPGLPQKGNSTNSSRDGVEIEYMRGRRSYIEVLSENGYSCGLSGKWHLGALRAAAAWIRLLERHAEGGGNYTAHPWSRTDPSYQPTATSPTSSPTTPSNSSTRSLTPMVRSR